MLGRYPSWLRNGSSWPPPAAGISPGGQSNEVGTRGEGYLVEGEAT